MHSCVSLLGDDLLSKFFHHSLLKKIELHMVPFTTVSSKLTSCINRNPAFNKSLKIHFHFFENMFYLRGDKTSLAYDVTTH
jgi:hypothetical protein